MESLSGKLIVSGIGKTRNRSEVGDRLLITSDRVNLFGKNNTSIHGIK